MNRTAIEFTGSRQLRLVQEPVPAPGPGQLLVRVRRSLVSTGTEGIIYARDFSPGTHFDTWIKYPFRPGYLTCGVVEAVGSDVTTFAPGDRVAARGQHASHVIVEAARSARVPENVNDESAAWMGLGKITQVGVRAAEHRLGDSVVVIGLGLLGQLVARYAHLTGAREIIAIDPSQARLDLLQLPIPIHRLAMGAAAALPEVERILGPRRADVVYDVTGHHAVFAGALTLARDFGTVVLLGDTGHPHLQTLTPDLIRRGLRIVGAHDRHPPLATPEVAAWTIGRMDELFLHYLSRRQIEVKSLVTHHFRPEDAAAAYEMLHTKRESVMGVMFDWARSGTVRAPADRRESRHKRRPGAGD